MVYDDIVVGAGHNGLTAAAYLARAGRRVLVLEAAGHVGGAAVSARVFPGVDADLSRYSYLVSLLPGRVAEDLDLDLRLVRRRIASYTPVPADPSRGLLVDAGDARATAASFRRVCGDPAGDGSPPDLLAWERFGTRLAALAGAVFPTMLDPLRDREAVRALVGDTELFDALTTRPLGEIVESTFADDTVRGAVATDGLIGTFDPLTGPGLAANICFLYHVVGGGTGDWDVPVGGMGAVSGALARAASAAGAEIRTGVPVTAVDPSGGGVDVRWEGGSARAGTLLAGCAPTVLGDLLVAGGAEPVPTETGVEGSQLKVNMLLTRLPRLRDPDVDPAAAFAGTLHVNEGYRQLAAAHAAASRGELPDPLPCEVYCHTLSDRSILGPGLADTPAQTLTLFGLHTPVRLFRDDPDGGREDALAAAVASLDSVLGEPVAPLLARDGEGRPCLEVRTPADLEADLGLPGGNIFHRTLQWPWAEAPDDVGRWGVETPYPNVVVCGAGARRGGGVSGIPGHNAARAVLEGR